MLLTATVVVGIVLDVFAARWKAKDERKSRPKNERVATYDLGCLLKSTPIRVNPGK